MVGTYLIARLMSSCEVSLLFIDASCCVVYVEVTSSILSRVNARVREQSQGQSQGQGQGQWCTRDH